MEHSYIEENQVAERYLMGQLPPDEAAAFEEHSLACAECLDCLELAEAMRRGFRQAAAREAAAKVGLAILARLGRSPRLAMMLLAIALLPIGLLTWRVAQLDRALEEARREERAAPPGPETTPGAETRALRDQLAEERRQAESALEAERWERRRLEAEIERAREPRINTPILSLGPERSGPETGETAEPAARVVLGSSAQEWIVLALELDGPEFPRYGATLLGPHGETVWRGAGLTLDSSGSLTLSLPASLLKPGDFQLRVEGRPPAGGPVPLSRFSFRVVHRR